MAFRAAVEQIDVMSSPPDEEGMTITVETMVSARVWWSPYWYIMTGLRVRSRTRQHTTTQHQLTCNLVSTPLRIHLPDTCTHAHLRLEPTPSRSTQLPPFWT